MQRDERVYSPTQPISALAGVASALVLAHAGTAWASEVCVKCTGPDASYACVVDSGTSSSSDSAINLYCISALAQSGQHASCAIDRNSAAPCQGVRKELPAPADFGLGRDDDEPDRDASAEHPRASDEHVNKPPAQEGASAPKSSPAASADGGGVGTNDAETKDAKPAAAQSDAPPRTVQEMVEKGAQSASKSVSDANKSAGDTMKKAGSAVGNAAKSTWKCLSSFFSDC